jgi:predicted dehydrogenase
MTTPAADLRVGIVGYGVVGAIRHRFVDEHPALRVVAVCDQRFLEPETGQDGVRRYTTYDQLLEAEELDALFVCVPNYLAPEATIAGLERDLHVFCEKPPGRDLADVARVRDVEARHPGRRLMYGFNHRYHDSVREAKRIIDSGELGDVLDMRGVYGKSKIISFESDWRTKREYAGGGILLDQGIHMVDMMRFFVRDEFTQISSVVSSDHYRYDVEDNAYALMRTDAGVVAMLQSSATQWRHRFNLEITLSRGAIALTGLLTNSKSYGAEKITVVRRHEDDAGEPWEQTTKYPHDSSFRDEVFDFGDAITGERTVDTGSSLEALKTMELVYRIYCADESWARRYGLTCELPVRDG